MKKDIAIIAVAYNRVDSLSRLLNSLEAAFYADEKPTLIISIDKSETDVVEKFADEYRWTFGEKIVYKHEKNLGLRKHMMSLGSWFDRFDTLVVLEDDIVVSPCFYSYVVQTSLRYKNNPEIAGVSLYGFEVNYQTGTPFQPVKDEHDTYFMNCAMSWGEIWLKDSWRRFYQWYLEHQEFKKEKHLPDTICRWGNKSWLKYHTRYCIEENKYFVFPYVSLSTNYADAGEHNNVGAKTAFQTNLQIGEKRTFNLPELTKNSILYDGFFENKSLYGSLGLPEHDCCLDLYGTQRNRLKKKYWLTTEKQKLPIEKSYAIRFRPLEENVFKDVKGNEIFLYNCSGLIPKSHTVTKPLLYLYHIDDAFLFVRKYGFFRFLKDVFVRLFK